MRPHSAFLDVVLEHATVATGAGAEVRALRQPGRGVVAVEPEGVLLGSEEPFEERLGRGLAGDRAQEQAGVGRGRLLRHRGVARAGAVRPLCRPHRRLFTFAGELEEVLDQPGAVVGGNRLGVELHSPHRPFAVFDPHHHAVVGPSADVAVGTHAGDRQRVVADDREALGNAVEKAVAFMEDLAEPAVHRLGGAAHLAVEHFAQALVAEANAEHWDLAEAEDVVADAEVVPATRRAGTR